MATDILAFCPRCGRELCDPAAVIGDLCHYCHGEDRFDRPAAIVINAVLARMPALDNTVLWP